MSLSYFKKLRIFVLVLLATITLSSLLIASIKPVSAQFDPLGVPCSEGQATSGSDVCVDSANPGDPLNGDDGIFNKAVNILSFLAGFIAVIIIFIAGLTMITSQGDPGKVKSSRDAIIYAAIGIVVIVLARSIVIFVYNRI